MLDVIPDYDNGVNTPVYRRWRARRARRDDRRVGFGTDLSAGGVSTPGVEGDRAPTLRRTGARALDAWGAAGDAGPPVGARMGSVGPAWALAGGGAGQRPVLCRTPPSGSRSAATGSHGIRVRQRGRGGTDGSARRTRRGLIASSGGSLRTHRHHVVAGTGVRAACPAMASNPVGGACPVLRAPDSRSVAARPRT